MAANTTRGITYPTGGDSVAPLHTILSTLATTADTAIGKVIFRPADLTALAATTGMVSGDVAVVTEGGALFEYSGTTWVQLTPASFSSASTRDTAYAKASAAYRVVGARVRRPEGWIEQYCPTPVASVADWYALDGARPSGILTRTNDLPGGTNTTASAAGFTTAPLLRGMSWSAGQSTRLVATVPGRFLLSALASIGSTANGTAWFRINGTTNRPSRTEANASGVAVVGVQDVVSLAANDYVELMTLSNGSWTLFQATTMSADLIGTR